MHFSFTDFTNAIIKRWDNAIWIHSHVIKLIGFLLFYRYVVGHSMQNTME